MKPAVNYASLDGGPRMPADPRGDDHLRMLSAPEHPHLAPLPDHSALGPDPEPIGHRTHLALLAPAARRLVARAAPPQTCPLAVALGNSVRCTGNDCLYFALPGVPVKCAVEHWTSSDRLDPALARWFLARRREAAAAGS